MAEKPQVMEHNQQAKPNKSILSERPIRGNQSEEGDMKRKTRINQATDEGTNRIEKCKRRGTKVNEKRKGDSLIEQNNINNTAHTHKREEPTTK